MDKSFNDQELSDIMKEIEALEEEFGGEAETDKVEASSSDMMEELAALDEEVSIPTTNRQDPTILPFEKKVTPMTKSTSSTAMSFKVQGDLNLELQFEIGGKTVMLEVSETGLNIKMEGGVTFSVPVADAQSIKKAV
ncbi:MAG: hypothetical protein H0V66_07760 [Bdellovibrionales bacterium]|nr:hypothetical protein [Bdellovibrionales bacterium]